MSARILDEIPRYGWNASPLIEAEEIDSLVSLVTDPVRRSPGLSRVAVIVNAEDGNVSDVGTFDVILEGSNTGDPLNQAEWTALGSLGSTELFNAPLSAPSVTKILGAGIFNDGILGIDYFGSGDVDVGRYLFLRLRAVIVSGAPDFKISVSVNGTSGDAERFVLTKLAVSVSGDSNEVVTDYITRPSGTRWLTASSLATSLILVDNIDPNSGLTSYIEGAVTLADAQAGNFVPVFSPATPIDTFKVVGDSTVYQLNGAPAVDMGLFNYFRIHVVPYNFFAPSTLSSYVIENTFCFDDNDWLQGNQGFADLSVDVRETFLTVRLGEPEPQVGTVRTITGQFVDATGNPVSVTGPFSAQPAQGVLLVSSIKQGRQYALDPTATASGSEMDPALQNLNAYPIMAGVNGSFTVDIDSNGTPKTVWVSVISYVPEYPRTFVVVSTDVAEVVLA